MARQTGMRLERPVAIAGLLSSLVAFTFLMAPSAAALSCVEPALVLKDATTIFTGKIVDGGPGKVLVDVDEVWRGTGVQEHTWLTVSIEFWSPWSGSDGKIPEGFSSAKTWLFAPENGEINPCEAWQLSGYVRSSASGFRPEHPAAPIAAEPTANTPAPRAPTPPDGRSWILAAAGSAVLALIAAGAAVVVRRRTPTPG